MEKAIPKVEKSDIQAPAIEAGGTAIVMQRHSKYERDRDIDSAGSILEADAALTREQDVRFFEDLLAQEQADGIPTMVLFVSSDTQYAGKGRRSMETAQLAQDAAVEVMERHDLNSTERILNFNPNFSTGRFDATGQDVRPMPGLVEPKIFDESPDFVKFLEEKYKPDESPNSSGMSVEAFAAYESDADKEVRESMGAEGVYDILDRTKKSVDLLGRYSRWFHLQNPGKRLVIWSATHYDTISPLVKDATNVEFDEFVGVDYGAGVVLEIAPRSRETILAAKGNRIPLQLGRNAIAPNLSET